MFGYVGQDPVNWIDPSGHLRVGGLKVLPSLQDTSDFAAGFGDGASFGITQRIRREIGVDDVVGYCSSNYTGGNIAGQVTRDVAIAVSPAGPASGLGRLPVGAFKPKPFWRYPPPPPSPLPPKTPSAEPWGQMF